MAVRTIDKILAPLAARKGKTWHDVAAAPQAPNIDARVLALLDDTYRGKWSDLGLAEDSATDIRDVAQGRTPRANGAMNREEALAWLAAHGVTEAYLKGRTGPMSAGTTGAQAESDGTAAYLAGKPVANEWFYHDGLGADAGNTRGAPTAAYLAARKLAEKRGLKLPPAPPFDPNNITPAHAQGTDDLELTEPSKIVGQDTGRVFGTIDENGARDPEMVGGDAFHITNPGKKQPAPKNRRAKGAPDFAGGLVSSSGTTTTAYGASSTKDKTAVTNAQLAANSASQAYVNQQKQANIASQQEAGRINAASRNTADLSAVAGANQRTDNQDYEFQAFGMKAPTRVAVRPGAPALAPTPGVTEGYETQQQREEGMATENSQARGFGLEASRLNASTAGLTASNEAIKYNAAPSPNAGHSTADDAAGRQASVERIRAAGSAAGERAAAARGGPVYPSSGGGGGSGAVGSNVGSYLGAGGGGGQYAATSAGEAELAAKPGSRQYLAAKSEAAGNRVVEDPSSGPEFGTPTRYMYAKDLSGMTDRAGNIKQTDGSYLDPRSGNVFVNGHWVEPKTGNTLINPKTWQSPEGFQYHITNPKSGTGYWQDKDGFVLGSDGEWTNRARGQVKIDGVVYQPSRPLSTRLLSSTSSSSEEESSTNAWK